MKKKVFWRPHSFPRGGMGHLSLLLSPSMRQFSVSRARVPPVVVDRRGSYSACPSRSTDSSLPSRAPTSCRFVAAVSVDIYGSRQAHHRRNVHNTYFSQYGRERDVDVAHCTWSPSIRDESCSNLLLCGSFLIDAVVHPSREVLIVNALCVELKRAPHAELYECMSGM